MKICGLQKLTLLDFPGEVACTVFLGGCNFRCPWCHNYSLTGNAPETMKIQELMGFLSEKKGRLDGVAITGGEPCLNADLPDLCKAIKEMGYKVKLDTNGSRYEMLRSLLKKGLVDYVAMDIKNRPNLYDITVGVERVDISDVMKSVNMLINYCDIPYEFRTTVVDELHEPVDFKYIGQWLCRAKKYYLQAFTDRESIPYNFHAPSNEKLQECLGVVRGYVESAEIRGV